MRKRIVLLFLALVLFIVVLTLLLIPTFFKAQVSDLVRKELNKNLEAEISFTSADINLWRHFPQFTVTLENLVIAGKHEFRGDTLVKAETLHLASGTFAFLFNDNIKIKHLSFNRANFHIVYLENGRANFDIVKRDSAVHESLEKENVSLDINSINVQDGTFRYEDHNGDIKLNGNELILEGYLDIKGNVFDFKVESGIKNFTTRINGENYIVNKDLSFELDGSYDSKNNTLAFKDNTVNINHLKLQLEGEYALNEGRPYFDIRFQSEENDFKDLLSLSDDFFSENFKGIDIKGTMALNGFIKGAYNPIRQRIPTFRVDFKVKDGEIKYEGLASSIGSINFQLLAENTDSIAQNSIIDIQQMKFKLGDNPISGFIKVNGLRDGNIKSNIKARVNLQDLTKIYPMDSVVLGGKLVFDVQANGDFSGSLLDYSKDLKITSLKKIPAFDVVLKIENGSIQYSNLPEAISGINFFLFGENKVGQPDSTIIIIDKIEARFGDNPLQGFLHLKGLDEPFMESELKATLDLADIKNFYPMEGIDAKGQFDLAFKLSGLWSERLESFPLADLQVKLNDGSFTTEKYPYPIENMHLVLEAFNGSGKLENTMIFIDTLTYTLEDEPFSVQGSISDLTNYKYDLAVNGVMHLNKLQKLLHLEDNIHMAGEIDMNFKTAGSYEDLLQRKYHRLPTDGQIALKGVSFESDLFNHLVTIEKGHLFFTNEKMFLDTLHGTIGASKFNLSGHLFNYLSYAMQNKENIQGDLLLESEFFDVNELLSESVPVKADSNHHDLVIFKVPEYIDFTFDTKIKKLKYKTIAAENLEGELVAKNGILTLNTTTFESMNAQFRLSGDYDTRNISHPLFDFQIKVDELNISKAHEAFVTVQAIAPAAENTFGVFSIDYRLKGELARNMYPVISTLAGGGSLRIREAKVNGMKVFHHISGMTKKEELMNPELKDIVMETEIDHGVIYVKPFSMKLAGFDTDIEGKHNVDGTMNYLLKLTLPPFEMVKIPLHINGTYENPKIHLGKGHEDVFKKITSNP